MGLLSALSWLFGSDTTAAIMSFEAKEFESQFDKNEAYTCMVIAAVLQCLQKRNFDRFEQVKEKGDLDTASEKIPSVQAEENEGCNEAFAEGTAPSEVAQKGEGQAQDQTSPEKANDESTSDPKTRKPDAQNDNKGNLTSKDDLDAAPEKRASAQTGGDASENEIHKSDESTSDPKTRKPDAQDDNKGTLASSPVKQEPDAQGGFGQEPTNCDHASSNGKRQYYITFCVPRERNVIVDIQKLTDLLN